MHFSIDAGRLALLLTVFAIVDSPASPAAFAADAARSPDSVNTTGDLAAWIDTRVASYFADIDTPEPALADDATFLRRVYLDILGTIPAVSEVRDFLDDTTDDKRARLIERLLADPRCAAHLARTWRRILMPQPAPAATMGGGLEVWLQEQFAADVAYDELARKLVTAGGAEQEDASEEREGDGENDEPPSRPSPAVAYLRAAGGDPASVAGSASRVFLGVRIHCAQCHDHPFADWTQQDFWGMAAFFAGARYNQPAPAGEGQDAPTTDQRIVSITPPDTGKTYQVGFLWDGEEAEIPEEKLPRQVFAEWLTSPRNPNFSATAVNRTWQHLCGNGLTDSVDDLDLADVAERAVVLDDLSAHFAAGGFDLKWLIAGICKSKAYQFVADKSAAREGPIRGRTLKVLSPEQVFDALEVALALPVSRIDDGPRYNGQRDRLIARLGEAAGDGPAEYRGGIPQMLMLMNGTITADATSLDTSRTLTAIVEAPFLNDYQKLETLFLATLTRQPSRKETRQFMKHVHDTSRSGQIGEAYAEIMWALINSPEFILLR